MKRVFVLGLLFVACSDDEPSTGTPGTNGIAAITAAKMKRGSL